MGTYEAVFKICTNKKRGLRRGFMGESIVGEFINRERSERRNILNTTDQNE